MSTATELLIQNLERLEETDKKILEYVKNIDNNYKIIIQRLDKLKKQPSNLEEETKINLPVENNNFTFPSFINEDSVYKDIVVKIVQQVFYPKDKVPNNNKVALANIKIFDKDKNLLKDKIHTDSSGKWKTELKPGEYFVHVVKPKTNNKPQIDEYFPLTLSDLESVVELPPING